MKHRGRASGVGGLVAILCTMSALASGRPARGVAQTCPEDIAGAWTAVFPAAEGFRFEFEIVETPEGDYEATVRAGGGAETVPVWIDSGRLRFQAMASPVAFAGTLTEDGSRLAGFVKYAAHVTHVVLPAAPGGGGRSWAGSWTPLGTPDSTLRLDLYVGDDGEGGLGGYFFFRDQRLTGLWGYGLDCPDGRVVLGEKNLGLWLEGDLGAAGDLAFEVTTATGRFSLTFVRMDEDSVPESPDEPERPARDGAAPAYVGRAPDRLSDGWGTATPAEVGIDARAIGSLVSAVSRRELAWTHSVLVARHDRLVVEEYFYGFDRETLHDMRSASKTITSTLVGLAVQEGWIDGAEDRALPYFANYRSYDHWDPRKADITVRDLLTMSSGLDANDSDFRSAASEGRYQSQTDRPDWIKLALDAPLLEDPGTQPLYGGANPMILGGILANAVEGPVEWFAHRTLFEPLGIESYSLFLDPTGIPYMGGGMWMRPRDMLKVGQMYLNGGTWRGREVLDPEWIEESWGDYGRLRPLDRNGHRYGYLWWHHAYEVDGATIETLEARGNGGQYIFVIPDLDMVVVITSGNFRNGRTREPEDILRRFILPAVDPSR